MKLRALQLLASVAALGALACQETPSAGEPEAAAQPAGVHAAADPRGPELFARHCALCHGLRGAGDGPVALMLFPPPRDLSQGRFRLASTDNGVPSQADLLATLRRGMPGSAMPAWSWLADEDLAALVAHVRELAIDGGAGARVDEASSRGERPTAGQARAAAEERFAPGAPLALGSPARADERTLARGQELYFVHCATCHGGDGKGRPDRPTWTEEGDLDWARDFSAGLLKGGADHDALAARILAGMPGTTMPATRLEDPADLAALIAFVQSLIPEGADERHVQRQGRLVAARVDVLPAGPGDPAWNDAPALDLALAPLSWKERSVQSATLTALHDGETLALRVRWADATRDDAERGVYPFGDAVAVQLSEEAEPPLFAMGSHASPVHQWHWMAMRLMDVAGRLDLMDHPPHARGERGAGVDAPSYVPALELSEDVDARTARGFDDVERVLDPALDVEARPRWADGAWEVVFVRPLAPRSGAEVDLRPGASLRIACAVWNGAAGDLRGQKSTSIWQQLEIR